MTLFVFYNIKMNTLIEKINQKNNNGQKIQKSKKKYSKNNVKNTQDSLYSGVSLNYLSGQEIICSEKNTNNKFDTPIKNDFNNSPDNNNIFQEISHILDKENASDIYKKKVLKLFETFIDYLVEIKKNKELIDNYQKFKKYNIGRIKIKDVEDFIADQYKNANPSTVANIKSRMRKFIRIINNEPNLDFSEKIMRPKRISDTSNFSKQELLLFLYDLNISDDIFSALLFYFIYFIGLNYSLVARILLKDLKASFRMLILKKGKKVIKHYFPQIITYLLFKYFISSRSYNSYYFFEDNITNNNKETRTTMIKNKFKHILDKSKHINKTKKNIILSYFSKLRRAKILTSNLYEFFILPNIKQEINVKEEYFTFSNYDDTNKNNGDSIIKSFSINKINIDIENNFSSENNSFNENVFEVDSICANFDSLINIYYSNRKENNKPLISYLKRNRSAPGKYLLNNNDSNLLSLISDS